ncbi:MAG: TonB-dependent receptor [Gammaproteobacteria bacterium]
MRIGSDCLSRACIIYLLVFTWFPAFAGEEPVDFHIPQQRADAALNLFAQQADIQLLFPYDVASQYYANEVTGRYTPEEAIRLLLDGTGLKANYSDQGNLTIQLDEQYQGEKTMNKHEVMNKKSGIFSKLSAVVLSAFAVIQGAPAQGTNQDGAVLEEVIVTARRVEEKLQDTPISVSAFTSENLERRQVFSTEDLDQVTPNLQFTNDTTLAGNNASSVIFIRGIGQTDPTSTVDPGVGLYIDDVYMGQSVGGTLDFRDIQSVQVLRGPQGTLFGRNTIGGAILLTTTEPGDEFGGNVRFGYGSDNYRNAFIGVDAPLTDSFRTRFTFGTRDQDGYVTRIQTGEDLGDTNTYTMTGKAVWDVNSRLSVKFQADYTHTDENGIPFVFAASNEDATFQKVASVDAGCPGAGFPAPPVPLIDDDRCANDFQNKGPYKNNGTFDLESKLENVGGSFHVNYNLNDNMTLKYIGSYRKLKWKGVRDADNTPLTILHTSYDSDGDQMSHEGQFLWNSETINGVIGFYYFEETIDDIVTVQLNTPAPGTQQDSDNNITDNSNWAVFSQWTYDFNNQLSLTFGGRYTEDTKASIPDQFNYAIPDVNYLPSQRYEETFTAFTMSGSVSYRWNENIMTYFSYSEGFKGGGWNSHFNTCQVQACITASGLAGPGLANAQAAVAIFPQVHSFDQEEATTYEIGIKLDLLNNTLRLNGAAFITDYTDLQFTYRAGVAPYLANAGEASIEGFELEAAWVPTDNWIIEGAVGYLNTSVDSLVTIAGTNTGVAVGNDLPFSPEWQANLGVGYTAHLGDGWMLRPRADFVYQDTTYFDAGNTPEISQIGSAEVLNLSISLEPANSQWRLTGRVNNATDELYATGGNSSLGTGSGYAEIGYARPREYFVDFSYNF